MDRISHLYDDYADILKEFGKNRIQERFSDIYMAYQKFIQKNNLENVVKINDFTLMHAILDYFTDISRLKRFHKISRTNTFKVVSYEISWLLRRKPLQILEDDDEELVYINEKFILSYIMSYLTELVGEDFYDKLSQENQDAFDGYIDSLFYYIKYRNCNSQALELALLNFGAGVVAANHNLHIKDDLSTKESNDNTASTTD